MAAPAHKLPALNALDILDRAHNEISALAASVGIDWSKAAPMLGDRPSKLTRGVELEPAYRGKTVVWFIVKTTKGGQEYPVIRFHTNKHGGITETFDGWQWLVDNGHAGGKPTFRPAPAPRPAKPARPVQDLDEWKQRHFNAFQAEFEALPCATITEGSYLARKGFADTDIPADFDLRQGQDKRGQFVAYALKGRHSGEVMGFQKIYDTPFIDGSGARRDKDFIFRPNSKPGSFAWLGTPVEGQTVYVCEGLATGLSVHAATGKAVAVALDAGNILPVGKLLSASFKVTIAADNDAKADGGNTGVFAALEAAWKASQAGNLVAVSVPALNESKCDFDDVRQATGIEAVRVQLANHLDMPTRLVDYLALRVTHAPAPQLKKAVNSLVFNAAKTLMRREELPAMAEKLRGVIGERDPSINVLARLEHEFRRRIEQAKPAHSITDFSGLRQHRVADSTEAANFMLQTGGVFIDAREMGAGKTETMRILADYARAKGEKLTYICHRISLTRSASNRLNLRHYEDVFAHYGECPQALGVCVNSITKHGVAGRARDGILLIDEARQTLEHLYDGTVDNRIGVYNELVSAIQNARLVVFADADMNQETIDWIQSIRQGVHSVIMPSTGPNGKSITPVKDFSTALDMASENLEGGANVWIACDSISKARESGLYFTGKLAQDDVLILHSENKADPAQAAFLADPDNESRKYRVVIHSPVISSGISITNSHFSKTYLISSGVLPANELLQSAARVRRVTEVFAVFNRIHNDRRETDYKKLADGEALSRSRYSQDAGGIIFTAFDNGRIRSKASRNQSLNNVEFEFYMLAEIRGYGVNTAIESRFPTADAFESGGLGKAAKAEKIASVMQSETISDTEAKRFDSMSALTQEQTDKLDLHRILKTTGKTKETLTEEMTGFCLFRGGFEKIANHRLLTTPKATLKDSDKTNLEYRNKLGGKTSKAMHFQVIAGVLLGSEFDSRAARAVCEHLAEHSGELAVCGLGSYGGTMKDPIKQLKKFVERFGYQVMQTRQAHDGKRWYRLAVNPLVAEAFQGGSATL